MTSPRRPLVAYSVTKVVINARTSGAASLIFEDAAIAIDFDPATRELDDLLIPMERIVSVTLIDDAVVLSVRGGTRVELHAPRSDELRERMLRYLRVVPELARALRGLGSRRASAATLHDASLEADFYAPLLDARRAAAMALEPRDAVGAIDDAAIKRKIAALIERSAAARSPADTPLRRALLAELSEVVDPLCLELDRLAGARLAAIAEIDDLERWWEWAGALRSVFECADRVWLALDRTLSAPHIPPPLDATGKGKASVTTAPRRR